MGRRCVIIRKAQILEIYRGSHALSLIVFIDINNTQVRGDACTAKEAQNSGWHLSKSIPKLENGVAVYNI